jgi:hypothetical protein
LNIRTDQQGNDPQNYTTFSRKVLGFTLMPIKQGNTTHEINDELLETLTGAYKEAAGRPIEIEHIGG